MKDFFSTYFAKFMMLLVISLSPLVVFAAGVTFNKIVFIGDSLSDNGNLYHITFSWVPQSPPYNAGRFSNGPVWSEQVASYYATQNITSSNYAVGGETAVYADHIYKMLPISLAGSIDDYLLHSAWEDRSKTLVVIWIGANDYLYHDYDVNDRSDKVIAETQVQIDKLVSHGVRNFMLVNLPDFSKAPYASENKDTAILSAAAIAHNAKLASLVSQEQANVKKVNIRLFDLSDIFNTLLTAPNVFNQKYGMHISNVTEACFKGSYRTLQGRVNEIEMANQFHELIKSKNTDHLDVDAFAQFVVTSPDLMEAYKTAQNAEAGVKPCADPGAFVFWDHLHPTTATHKILAMEAIAFLNQNFRLMG